MEAVETLRATGYASNVVRYSLRYSNILPLTSNPLESLRVSLNVAGLPINVNGFRLRFEKAAPPFVSVVECSAIIEAVVSSTDNRQGVLFAIDTIRQHGASTFFEAPIDHLRNTHDVLEALFLALVSEEALEAMGAVWEQDNVDGH